MNRILARPGDAYPFIFVAMVAVLSLGNVNSASRLQLSGIRSGCSDGTTEGLQSKKHWKLAACDGRWEGHVNNASGLCAPGWMLCGWNTTEVLRTLNWKDAMALSGCYAVNAAQDNGQCRPCVSEAEQDDLAGVGSGCPHRRFGVDSCISGGQMDASCCTDTYYSQSCAYRPGLTTGVLCCRQSGTVPQLVVPPARLTHAQVGSTFVLSCQAVGSPVPLVTWLRNGRVLSVDTIKQRRVAVFDSGYLIVSDAQLSDTDQYQCQATNTIGSVTATAHVVVTEHSSGCADGSTEGLIDYEEIQACQGRWRGHVKRAKLLCASGWQVCTPRHSSSLKLLSWSDAADQLDGCFAYNAANSLNLCSVCHNEDMAGVGRHCGRHRVGHKSCLADGRIDVHETKSRGMQAKCEYSANRTTGVLCCRRPEKWQLGYRWSVPECHPQCQHGGVCIADGQCQCAPGYKGAHCQNPVCPGGCIPNSVCIRPAMCRCLDGFSGPKCKGRPTNHTSNGSEAATASVTSSEVIDKTRNDVRTGGTRCHCLNGGRCVGQRCKCRPTHRGHRCEYGDRTVVMVGEADGS